MNAPAVADASAASRFAALALDAVRAIRWPQVRAAVLLGLALTAWKWTVSMQPIALIAKAMPLGSTLLQSAIADQLKALCLLVAIVIADRAVDEGARRRRAYLVAALAGCVAGIALTDPFHWAVRTYLWPDLWPANFTWLHGTRAVFYWPIFHLTQWLLIGSAVVFLYADRRAARKTAQLLRDAELERIRRSRLALESRLQAMQARVEPQFLFNTLSQVERLYELDALLAARMLDELIAYLRAAMPLMRNTSSTVAQELDLMRAYLNIIKLRLGDRLAFEIDVPEGIGDARLPPMMLLPLIDHAIVVGLEWTPLERRIRISVEPAVNDLRLVVDSGAVFIPETDGHGIGAIRQRLDALYGDRASLVLRRRVEGTMEAVLHIPLEIPQQHSGR